jgi:hypothetical protein
MTEPDLEHVPTVPELALKGLAFESKRSYVDPAGKVRTEVRYQLTDEGQQRINDAMHRNAQRGRAWDEARRASA